VLSKLRTWIPLVVATTVLCGLVYLAVQQDYRQSANDPQIQVSEDLSRALSTGEDIAKLVPTETVDLSTSLATFMIVYDDSGQIVASTAKLDGATPTLPSGVLDFVKTHGQERLTWQPKTGVRSATVVTRFVGKSSGYVLAGRSLREVEKREEQLLAQISLAWVAAILATLATTLVFVPRHKKPHEY